MARKKRIQIETSKLIFYMITTITVVVVVFSMALMWRTKDTSALSYLIPSVFTEMATCTGFYFWKARKENEIKLQKKYGTIVESENESEDQT